jgi:hypothetical protein
MTAARAIVLLVAAACASAAQAGGETLREQVAATLGATTLCQASPCPSGFNTVSGFCCGASPVLFNCISIGGSVTGTLTCGTQIVQCSALTSLPVCSTLPPSPGSGNVNMPAVLLAVVGTLVAAMP